MYSYIVIDWYIMLRKTETVALRLYCFQKQLGYTNYTFSSYLKDQNFSS